jgi:hypothetical protein
MSTSISYEERERFQSKILTSDALSKFRRDFCFGQKDVPSLPNFDYRNFPQEELHSRLRVFDQVEKIVFKDVSREVPDDSKGDERKEALRLLRKKYFTVCSAHGIYRHWAGISGTYAMKWFHCLPEILEDLGDLVTRETKSNVLVLVKRFLRICEFLRSKKRATHRDFPVLKDECTQFGQTWNRMYPNSKKSKSLYLHDLKHLAYDYFSWHSMGAGTAQPMECANALAKLTKQQRIQRGNRKVSCANQIISKMCMQRSYVVRQHCRAPSCAGKLLFVQSSVTLQRGYPT